MTEQFEITEYRSRQLQTDILVLCIFCKSHVVVSIPAVKQSVSREESFFEIYIKQPGFSNIEKPSYVIATACRHCRDHAINVLKICTIHCDLLVDNYTMLMSKFEERRNGTPCIVEFSLLQSDAVIPYNNKNSEFISETRSSILPVFYLTDIVEMLPFKYDTYYLDNVRERYITL